MDLLQSHAMPAPPCRVACPFVSKIAGRSMLCRKVL